MKFEDTSRTYHLVELARGDYNHDGVEDSLVQMNWRYVEGSGAGIELLLVQRSATGPLTVTLFPLQ